MIFRPRVRVALSLFPLPLPLFHDFKFSSGFFIERSDRLQLVASRPFLAHAHARRVVDQLTSPNLCAEVRDPAQHVEKGYCGAEHFALLLPTSSV